MNTVPNGRTSTGIIVTKFSECTFEIWGLFKQLNEVLLANLGSDCKQGPKWTEMVIFMTSLVLYATYQSTNHVHMITQTRPTGPMLTC